MNAPANDAVYSTLSGRYRIEAAIGRGGAATVYRAHDEQLGRDVALKLFDAHSSHPSADHSAPRRNSELKVLASLTHHGIVTMLDAGVHVDGRGQSHHYLVMELVDGLDLQRRLAVQELSSRQIGEIGYDIAEALEYVHARGVVHRDIKPSNILTVEYLENATRIRAQLTDFGIARSESDARLTVEGATTGTAGYMSPEQAASEPVGPPTDVYSLGLVLLECFTHEMAYPGSQVQSALARLLSPPPIPDRVPEGWAQLIRAMTARDPAARPPLRDLVSAIRQLIIDESGRHKDAEGDDATVDEIRATVTPIHDREPISAAHRYDLLDTPPDDAFERVTALAARTLGVPLAVVSIANSDRSWSTTRVARETEAEPVSETSAAHNGEFASILGLQVDPRTLVDPATAKSIGLTFTASAPLLMRDGFTLGTLSVFDIVPREITADDTATLEDLAAIVTSEIELRLESRRAILDATGDPTSGRAAAAEG